MNYPQPPFGWPLAPPAKPKYSTMDAVVAAVCGVIGANALLGVLFFGGIMMLSLVSSDPHADPHGYSIVFGNFIGVPSAIVAALTQPAVFPPRVRGRAYAVSAAVFVALMVAGYAVLEIFG